MRINLLPSGFFTGGRDASDSVGAFSRLCKVSVIVPSFKLAIKTSACAGVTSRVATWGGVFGFVSGAAIVVSNARTLTFVKMVLLLPAAGWLALVTNVDKITST